MVIIETSVFTRRIAEILDDDEYGRLQAFVASRPDSGAVIPGSGGLRKLRWKVSGGGKRGGTRIIYYWWHQEEMILMLFAFRKSERSDLTKSQLQTLRKIVDKELK